MEFLFYLAVGIVGALLYTAIAFGLPFLGASYIYEKTNSVILSIFVFVALVFSVLYAADWLGFLGEPCDPMIDRYCN